MLGGISGGSLGDALGGLLGQRNISIKIMFGIGEDKDALVDGTEALLPHLTGFEFTDKSDDELDDLQLHLSDRKAFLINRLPKNGVRFQIILTFRNWDSITGTTQLDCGLFEIDEVTFDTSFDGGDTVTIKGTPSMVTTSLRDQRKTRMWNNQSIQAVIADVAGASGFDVLYKGPEIVFARVEQRQEADLAFIKRIVEEQGLRLCIKNKKLIVYMGQTADSTEPILFVRDTCSLNSISFKRSATEIYKKAIVSYTDNKDETNKGEAVPPDDPPPTEKVLTIRKRIEHPAQAERVAKAALREKNSQEITGSFTAMGDPGLTAGKVFKVSGFGSFDKKKYLIKQVKHSMTFDSGYTVSADFETALDY